jgi:hypothetical protein
MFFYCCVAHPTVLARRETLVAHPYRDTYPHCEDYDLWLRLLCLESGESGGEEGKREEDGKSSPEPEAVGNGSDGVRIGNLSTPLLRLRKHGSRAAGVLSHFFVLLRPERFVLATVRAESQRRRPRTGSVAVVGVRRAGGQG